MAYWIKKIDFYHNIQHNGLNLPFCLCLCTLTLDSNQTALFTNILWNILLFPSIKPPLFMLLPLRGMCSCILCAPTDQDPSQTLCLQCILSVLPILCQSHVYSVSFELPQHFLRFFFLFFIFFFTVFVLLGDLSNLFYLNTNSLSVCLVL